MVINPSFESLFRMSQVSSHSEYPGSHCTQQKAVPLQSSCGHALHSCFRAQSPLPEGQLFLHNHVGQQLPFGEHGLLLRGAKFLLPSLSFYGLRIPQYNLFPSVFREPVVYERCTVGHPGTGTSVSVSPPFKYHFAEPQSKSSPKHPIGLARASAFTDAVKST